MSEQAARFVGSIPENYDRGLGPYVFDEYAADLSRRVADLQPRSVLELAAGTGIVTRKLRDSLAENCDLLASDLNPQMLDVAKAKFRSNESVRFAQADAMDLDFGGAIFDVVVCQFGVMFFPDKRHSYTEVHRVLNSQGSYIFNVWDSWDANPFAQITHEVVAHIFPDDPPGFYKVPFGYHNADEILQSLSQAGFAQVNIESLSLKSRIPSADDFAKGLVFGNPLYEEIVMRGGDPQEVCTAVAKAIDQQLGRDMPLKALIVQASKI